MLIIEEAAFVSLAMWMEVVAPLMELALVALIAISSPLGRGNYFSQLTESESALTGKRLFTVFHARGACSACIDTLDDPSHCPHVSLPQPPWKSAAQREVAKAFYLDKATYARESLGVVTDHGANVFNRDSISQFMSADLVDLPPPGSHGDIVYVSVDPCGEGASLYGMVSMMLVDNQVILIGGANDDLGSTRRAADATIRHVFAIQEMFKARNRVATVVLIVETNLSGHAENIIRAVEEDPMCDPIQALTESRKIKAGVRISNHRKDAYVQVVTRLLDTNGVKIFNECITTVPANELWEQLRMQLLAYRCIDTDSYEGNAFRPSKITYSGKVDANGKVASNQMQDDLVIAFQQAVYWSYRHREISSHTRPHLQRAEDVVWE